MAFYINQGTTKVIFIPTAAAYVPATGTGVASAAEIAAGTDLSPQIAVYEGFDVNTSFIEAPVLSTKFAAKIAAADQIGEPSLTFRDSNASTAVRTLLATGVSGFIGVFVQGTAATKPQRLFPIVSAGVNDIIEVAANDTARFKVSFSVPSKPADGVNA